MRKHENGWVSSNILLKVRWNILNLIKISKLMKKTLKLKLVKYILKSWKNINSQSFGFAEPAFPAQHAASLSSALTWRTQCDASITQSTRKQIRNICDNRKQHFIVQFKILLSKWLFFLSPTFHKICTWAFHTFQIRSSIIYSNSEIN
jgi:hypothetical protein